MKHYYSHSIMMPVEYASIDNKKELARAFLSTYYFNSIGCNELENSSNLQRIFDSIKDLNYSNSNLWKCIWFTVFENYFKKNQLTYHSSFAAGYRNIIESIDDAQLRKVLFILDICADAGDLFSVFPTYNIRRDVSGNENSVEYLDLVCDDLINIFNTSFKELRPRQQFLHNEYFNPEDLFMESVTIHSLCDKMRFDDFIGQYLSYLDIDDPYKFEPVYNQIVKLIKKAKRSYAESHA